MTPIPPFPERPEDTWKPGPRAKPAPRMFDVAAAGGLVVSAGSMLQFQRPGAARIYRCELPHEDAAAVAVEPWAPRRFALAAPGRISVFDDDFVTGPAFELEFTAPERPVTHMAWSKHGGETMLYFRQEDGKLGRVRLESQTIEYVEIKPVLAIAADSNGMMAMIEQIDKDDVVVWTSAAGQDWHPRPAYEFPSDLEDRDHVYLAVEGNAVAFMVAQLHKPLTRNEYFERDVCGGTVSVSWDPDADFSWVHLCADGPLAFEGEQALFVTYRNPDSVMLFRQPRVGEAIRIVDIEHTGTDEDYVPTITGIAWDASRQTLWAASPQFGLFGSTAPGAKPVVVS